MSMRRFERAMAMMRETDPRHRENGFDFLREHADAYVAQLAVEFGRESDLDLRCLLLELLAEARSPQALEILSAQLASDEEPLRFWAVRGLEMLDTRQARAVLEQAEADGQLV
ncbi:HEAT repeat domain-containing protein [Actinomadura macrotermitis]|uniref:HEAT repeat domain-containing protein n=1 Tax=Actinomadura macrotermitis TaxID=2585200 RepID=A0A7K0C5P2_9ACTN|nr:HEAT repeat domain-containing protein [Actinomadura macrotermitis]MQY08769.1 hypothetical protein [Actinomadura macrotermitis]